MSADEILVVVVSGALGALLWARWYWLALRPPAMLSSRGSRWPLIVVPPVSALLLLAVLLLFSSHDVRSDAKYVVFYLVLGAAWLGLARLPLPFLGLWPREDVVERRNAAARFAVAGALLGLTLCFAGGNIGDGPGWWVVVFAAALATGAWYVLGFLLQLGGTPEQVAVERDVAAGVRLGGLLVAMGLVLGRSVAGTWISVEATLDDLVRLGWPALALAACELLVARLPRPADRPDPRPVGLFGVLPAAAYAWFAALHVARLGWWT